MFKFTKLLGLALLSTTAVQAQLVENFDDPTVTAPATTATVWELPSGTWQIFDNGVGSINWSLNAQATFPAHSGTKAAYINRQNIGQSNQSLDYLASPLIQAPVNPQVRFFTRTSYAQDTGTIFHLKAAPGGADPADPASYTVNLGTWTEPQLNPNFEVYNEIVVDITAAQQANLGTSFHIAFVKDYTQTGSAISGERWLVDDVRVISNCLPAENVVLTATDVQINGNWNMGAADTIWAHVVVAGTDFDPATTTAQPMALTGAAPYTITSTTYPTATPIVPITEYEVYLLSECAYSVGTWTTAYPIMTSSAPPVCGGNYVDNGGVTGNYSASTDETVTICPQNPGDVVIVTFTSFDVESNYDGLFVYNGNSVLAPQISSGNGAGQIGAPGAFWGTTIPGPFESATDGCLTFRFVSDNMVQYAGFSATIQCVPAPTCPKPINLAVTATFDNRVNLTWAAVDGATEYEILYLPCGSAPTIGQAGMVTTTGTSFEVTGLTQLTCYDFYVRAICGPDDASFWSIKATTTTQQTPPACGDVFVDNGGVDGDYLSSTNSTITICPENPGEVVRVTFTSFATEANYDGLYVYDGNSINSPIIASTNGAGFGGATMPGAYWGNTIPGPFESSSTDGCLTFRFISDGGLNYAGWTANVECVDVPTCPRVTNIEVADITPTTAQVTWNPGSTETEWLVYAVACGSPIPTYGQNGGVVVTGTPAVSLTDLASASCYNIYIFANCAADDQSIAQGPVVFNTAIAPPVCGGNLVDNGGLSGNYSAGLNEIVTICPQNPGDFVTVEFSVFNTESNWDGMYVYDGDSVNAPLIPSGNGAGNGALGVPGAYWGTTIPGPFEASGLNGCLTFQFISDSSFQQAGWVANIICAPIPTCPKPNGLAVSAILHNTATFTWNPIGQETQWMVFALPCDDPKPNSSTPGGVVVDTTTHVFENLDPITCYKLYVIPLCSDDDHGPTAGPLSFTSSVAPPICGGTFMDEGGNEDYTNNQNYVVTICPENEGEMVTVLFTHFDVEPNWDGMFVFDGNSVTSPIIPSGNTAGFGAIQQDGAYWGSEIPGPFFATSPSGCLTFQFISDNYGTRDGWLADVICSPAPSCDKPTAVTVVESQEDGFLVSWTTPDPAITQWEVLIIPASDPYPYYATSGWQVATTNPYFYAMDMNPQEYAVYVRAVCTDGTNSFWSTPALVNPFVVTGNSEQYSVEELVHDVLLKSTCALVENITYSTASGIGYFERNLSNFPFADGVVLTTGVANRIHGPNTSQLGDDNGAGADLDLEAIVFEATGDEMDSGNASTLEFDFTPISPNFKFRFTFASEEYGEYQCDYSDAFAFILTDLTAGTPPVNIALIPGTATPISVVTVRDGLYYDGWGANCGSLNEQYFSTFWGDNGEDPLTAPINYNGITVPFQIDHIVIPGNTYHIKLVIADRWDTSFDSAVFIEGNSLDIGNIELGDDFVAADGTAFCEGDSYELQTGLIAEDYTFEWTKDGEVLPGETGASYLVVGPGLYGVTATYLNSTCTTSDSVTIEFYENMNLESIEDLAACDPSGFATFDLTEILDELPSIVGEWDIFPSFHLNEEDASTGANPIVNLEDFVNTVANAQTIYIRVENIDTGCTKVEPIEIMVSDTVPAFNVIDSLTFCEGESETIQLDLPVATVYTEIVWYLNGEVIPGEATPTLTVTEAGTYTARAYVGVCYAEADIVVTVIEAPQVVTGGTFCDAYTLPAIVGAGAYYTQSGGLGEMLTAGTVITSTQTLYVYNDGCAEVAFTVTIQPTPTITVEGACINNVFTLTATVPSWYTGDIIWAGNDAAVILGTGDTYVPTVIGTYYATAAGSTATIPQCVATSAPFEVTTIQCMIQKGISADGDGVNDYFDLAGYAVSKLSVYNRYGLKVYDRGNYSVEFVGKDNDGNELPVGTYYYVIELSNGQSAITGWIYIAR